MVTRSAMDDDRVEYSCSNCGAINRIPRSRVRDDPRCGRCKASIFPDHPVAATDATWKREVEDCPIPVLVDFWAPWCGPCHAVAPVLEQAAKERKGKLKIVKLNVDENPRISTLHQVQSIPTLILQRGPLFIGRMAGALPKSELDAFIDRYVCRRCACPCSLAACSAMSPSWEAGPALRRRRPQPSRSDPSLRAPTRWSSVEVSRA